jgi:hypothetical protein
MRYQSLSSKSAESQDYIGKPQRPRKEKVSSDDEAGIPPLKREYKSAAEDLSKFDLEQMRSESLQTSAM